MKNRIFTAILVVYLLVSPGPLGVRPAHALVPLAPIAVGAAIAAVGVMVAGAGVYKPPTFAQANAAVDSVTGDITRKVAVARMIGEGATAGYRGFMSQYTLDFGKAYQWIKDHMPDFPTLGPAATSATVPISLPGPGVGTVYNAGAGNQRIGTVGPTVESHSGWPESYSLSQVVATLGLHDAGGNRGVNTANTYMYWGFYFDAPINGVKEFHYCYAQITVSPTNNPVYPVPTSYGNPVAFAAAYPNTEAGQDETDKIAAQNPSAIKSEPQAITPEQYAEAAEQAKADMLQDQARLAEAAAAADPTNTALQVAAQQARSAADQASIEAQGKTAALEATKDTPEEESTTVPPTALPLAAAPPAIDFSPLYAVKDAVNTHYPFVLVGTLTSYFSCLVSDAQAPAFTWPFFGHDITLSLSAWDNFATLWRASLLFFFNGACIYAILRRWS